MVIMSAIVKTPYEGSYSENMGSLSRGCRLYVRSLAFVSTWEECAKPAAAAVDSEVRRLEASLFV